MGDVSDSESMSGQTRSYHGIELGRLIHVSLDSIADCDYNGCSPHLSSSGIDEKH